MSQFNITLKTIYNPDETPDETPGENTDGDSNIPPIDNNTKSETPSSESSIPTPDTGIFTHDSSPTISPLLFSGAILFIVLSAIFIAKYFRHHHKVMLKNQSFNLGSAKKQGIIISTIILASISILSILSNKIPQDENTSAATGETLSLSTTNINLNINREANREAYGVTPNTITVTNSTNHGYTMGMYASSTNLVLTNDSTKKISTIAVDQKKLTPNTWGYSAVTPGNQDSEVWNAVPTTRSEATILKETILSTPANDTTTIYYGANLDSSLPDGTYSGVEINYFAIAKIVTPDSFTVSFNANGGTNSPSNQTCTIADNHNDCSITIPSTVPTRTGYTFLGWANSNTATTAQYQPNATITISTNKTIYAVWLSQTGKIHYINTGGSNAFLVESNGRYGLIDSSNALFPSVASDETTCMSPQTCVENPEQTVQKVTSYLDEIGVETLDFVIASHSHSDHIGGMPIIARHYAGPNTKYYYREYVTTRDDVLFDWHNGDYCSRAVNAMINAGATPVEVTNKEPSFKLGDLTIKLLNTEPATGIELNEDNLATSENLNSIVILITLGDKKVLFASDMHVEDEEKIANKVGAIDVLQMAHHGNTTSSSDYFIQTTKPKDIIIPAASINDNKNFSAIVNAFKNHNSNLYLTGGAQKAVIATLEDNSYTINYTNTDSTTAKIQITTTPSSTGEWYRISNRGYGNISHGTKWVHLNSNNHKLDTGWKWLDYDGVTSKYYFNETSGARFSGWLKDDDGYWYYLDSNGRMVANELKEIDGNWYYFDAEGRMVTETWQRIGSYWYYFESNGKMVSSEWKKIMYQGQLQWFYFQADGKMVTGAQTIDNEDFTFDSNGVCIEGRGCSLN